MKKKYIDPVPIFDSTQTVQNLLDNLSRISCATTQIILCNAKKQIYGLICLSKFYQAVLSGIPTGDSLASLCHKDYITITKDCSYLSPLLLSCQKPIIVLDKDNAPLGILKKELLLSDHLLHSPFPSFSSSSSLFQQLDFGVILLDIYGNIQTLNPAAHKLLSKAKIRHLRQIDDLIPRFDYSFSTKSYSVFANDLPLEIFSYPYFSSSDRLSQIVLVLFDVSALSEKKKALRETRSLCRNLTDILEHSYDEIYVTDNSGVCIFVNSACERIYGLKREDMIGKTSAQMQAEGNISSDLSLKVIQTKQRLFDIQTTKIGQKILVIANPIFASNGEVKKVVINSRELSDMVDFRISADKLTRNILADSAEQLLNLTLNSDKIVAESDIMKQIVKQVTYLALAEASILLIGETGSGKHFTASLFHELSPRRTQPLVQFHCSSIPSDRIGALLFGDCETKDSNSTTVSSPGLLALANGGNLLLENIDALPIDLQNRLYHAIKNKCYLPSNTNTPITTDFRLIATTEQDLQSLTADGTFSPALFSILNPMSIRIPPLRHRKEDIPFFIQRFLKVLNKKSGQNKHITPQAIDLIKQHTWKSNISELKIFLERLYFLSEKDTIDKNSLKLILDFHENDNLSDTDYFYMIGSSSLPSIIESFEKNIYVKAMRHCSSTYELANLLGISQPTVVRKLKKYDLHFV